jgi:outer membrane protein TolC
LQAVLAQEVVKVQQQVLEVVEAHLKQAEMLYQQGIVAQYDVLRARAELASQQKRLTDAQNQYALAMSLLLSLLNLPQEQKITLSTPLRELVYSGTYEDTLKSATETSHEIKALQAKTRALQALALSAEAEAKPQVLFSVNLETLTEDLSAIEPHASLTIGVRWNLFDAGYAKAVAREHRETAERTRIDQQRLENALALRIKQAMFEMESAQQGLKAAQRSVEASQESLRLAQRRFETGVGTSVEILDAILAVSQAKIQQQLALYQMDNAYYTLLHLTNQLLKELGTNP